eukprot:1290337-Rhodomonas_salina.4
MVLTTEASCAVGSTSTRDRGNTARVSRSSGLQGPSCEEVSRWALLGAECTAARSCASVERPQRVPWGPLPSTVGSPP